jgi:hypothetical protein
VEHVHVAEGGAGERYRVRVPTLSIECEPCGRRGRYNVARLMEKYGNAKLPELRHVLANCPKSKSKSFSVRDCKVRYGEDSRF